MSEKTTVVIADSFEIIREGVARKLTETGHIEVVSEASDGYSTLNICRKVKPNILLMDLGLTRPSGIETIEKIRASCPQTAIVILSSEVSIANAFCVLSLGAVSFIPKQARGEDFVSAISAAANGFSYIPKSLMKEFVTSRRNILRTGNAFGLSPRELEILEACVSGHSTKEVARQLEISVRTVETHRNGIYRKTDCNCLDQLHRVASAINGQNEIPEVA